MLPDFPKQKAVLSTIFMDYLRARTNGQLGPFTDTPRHSHHEGNQWALKREDGSEQTIEYKPFSSYLQIDLREVPHLKLSDILQKLDKVAEDMAMQMGSAMFNTIMQGAEEVGNTVDLRGQQLTPDAFLDTLRMIEMSFDEGGKPALQIAMNPATAEKFRAVSSQWDQDEEFHRKFDRLMEQKRQEWRDREADRKLVD